MPVIRIKFRNFADSFEDGSDENMLLEKRRLPRMGRSLDYFEEDSDENELLRIRKLPKMDKKKQRNKYLLI